MNDHFDPRDDGAARMLGIVIWISAAFYIAAALVVFHVVLGAPL